MATARMEYEYGFAEHFVADESVERIARRNDKKTVAADLRRGLRRGILSDAFVFCVPMSWTRSA